MVQKRTLALGGFASLLAGAAARVVYERRSTSNVPYETVGSVGGAELRRYPTTVVVETAAPSEHQAFGRLVRYVSGNNVSETELSPLPSVASEGETRRTNASESKSGSQSSSASFGASPDESASTAASARTSPGEGDVRMAFYLPETYDFDSAPRPADPNVRVVELPERTLAVKSLPRWTVGGRVEREKDELLSALRAERADVQVVGDPFVLRYDAPGASSFLRTNEAAVEVRRVAEQSR